MILLLFHEQFVQGMTLHSAKADNEKKGSITHFIQVMERRSVMPKKISANLRVLTVKPGNTISLVGMQATAELDWHW